MPTKEVYTDEGKVTYETEECSLCEMEVVSENITEIAIGKPMNISEYSSLGKKTIEFPYNEVEIHKICNDCHDNPIAEPEFANSAVGSKGLLHHLYRIFSR